MSGGVTARKKRSAASRQRAKARRQQRAAVRATGSAASTEEAQPAVRPARRPGDRPPRTPARSRRSTRRSSWALIGVVAAIAAFIVIVFLTRTGDDTGRGEAAAGSIERLTSVPAATLEAVGVPPRPSNVNPLPPDTPAVLQEGKPVVLYVGAEYCPFCAVERWPMVVALSRFGTFTGLASTTSAPPPETLPNTPTVTFSGATYDSDYVVFSSVETETRDFEPLDTPTELQQRLFDTYNVESITGSSGGIPFVMIGNLYAWAGSQYDYGVLEGKDFDGIVAELRDPTTDTARQIGGAANYITAMICRLTDGQPQDVCSSDVIRRAQAALPAP